MEVGEWLRKNDVRLYAKKVTKGRARKEYVKLYGKVSARKFTEAVSENCLFWRQVRRKPIRKNHSLTEKHWERLKSAVRELLPYLHGLSIDEAVEVVRSRVSCSRQTLNGIASKELRVWRNS